MPFFDGTRVAVCGFRIGDPDHLAAASIDCESFRHLLLEGCAPESLSLTGQLSPQEGFAFPEESSDDRIPCL
jgi:hypothetical protein